MRLLRCFMACGFVHMTEKLPGKITGWCNWQKNGENYKFCLAKNRKICYIPVRIMIKPFESGWWTEVESRFLFYNAVETGFMTLFSDFKSSEGE